jgi:hypothetical protein
MTKILSVEDLTVYSLAADGPIDMNGGPACHSVEDLRELVVDLYDEWALTTAEAHEMLNQLGAYGNL